MEASVMPSRTAPASLSRISWDCCAACGAVGGRDLVRLDDVPSNSCLMLPTAEAARAWPRGEIALRLCESCGFIANRAIDPRLTEYSERYEPTQGWSPAFQRYHQGLAERMAAAVPLAGRRVVEVGCGQGEFLHLLCGLTGAEGLGFDPCLDDKRGDVVAARAGKIELIAEFFDDAAAESLQADLLVCKMTLEHIPAVGHFAALCARVAQNSSPGMHLFIQVPDSLRILRDVAFEDVYYEHCNYFTETSLVGLFARHGFQAQAIYRDYDGQYLGLLARFVGGAAPAGGGDGVAEISRLASHYSEAQPAAIDEWRRRMWDAGRVVVWGSGSKGVAFLAALGSDAASVTHAVDINPHRQGMHMIGTGHPIIGPQELRAIAPETVVVMNRVYGEEVRTMLAAQGLSPRILLL